MATDADATMVAHVQGIPVAYEERGSGRPILLVHGWSGDRHYMVADLEPAFALAPGWRRIYLDLPGHGRTPAPDWLSSQRQVVSVLVDFVAGALDGDRFAIAGSSYGGYLTLALVRSIPQRLLGAALLVPDLPAADGSRDATPRATLVEDPAAFADLDEDERWIPECLVEQSRRAVEEIRRHEMPALRACDRAYLARLEENYVLEGPLAQRGAPFERPSLIVTGRQDSTVGYRAQWGLLDEFPRATFATCDLAGHWLGRIERPALFTALVSDWLARIDADIASRRRP